MKIRMLKAGMIGALMTALLVAAAGCGGDGDTLTLEEYFQQVDEVDNKTEEKTDALTEDLGDTEDIDKFKDAFNEFPNIIDDFLKDMEDLNPPDAVKAEHEAVIAAGRDSLDEFDAVLDELNAAETLDDVLAAVGSDAFNAADEAFTETCVALQTIADDNNLNVELDCGG